VKNTCPNTGHNDGAGQNLRLIPLAIPAVYALSFMQIFFRVFCQYGTAERGRFTFFRAVSITGALLIFVNKVDVYGEEQQVKGKEVGDFADAAFHSDGFVGFGQLRYTSSIIPATKHPRYLVIMRIITFHQPVKLPVPDPVTVGYCDNVMQSLTGLFF